MKCEHCQSQEANIHFQQTMNGQSFQIHLCSSCASELGYGVPGVESFAQLLSGVTPDSPSEQLWSQFFGMPTDHVVGQVKPFGQVSSPHPMPTTQERCPKCGMTLSRFASSSLLGCPTCYETFGHQLDAVLKRVQAGNRHVGRKMQDVESVERSQSTDTSAEEHDANATIPTGDNTVDNQYQRLKEAQDAAVEAEDYEEAARIRDQIKALGEAKGGA